MQERDGAALFDHSILPYRFSVPIQKFRYWTFLRYFSKMPSEQEQFL